MKTVFIAGIGLVAPPSILGCVVGALYNVYERILFQC